jgi:soluble P-type ATPase
MTIQLDIPGRGHLELDHVLLDQNGTLSDRGDLIDGVGDRLLTLKQQLTPHILTADTFGTLELLVEELGVEGHRIRTGTDKHAFMQDLGPARCAAVGNGRNDVEMLRDAALGIAVLGPEGISTAAITAADIVSRSILDALELLLDPQLLIATLRS